MSLQLSRRLRSVLVIVVPLVVLAGINPASATKKAPKHKKVAVHKKVSKHQAAPVVPWTVSWATAQHADGTALSNQSVRMIAHLTEGGTAVRVRIGNTTATAPLSLGAVSVGIRSSGAAVVPGTIHALTFNGSSSVTIPAGQYAVSDGVTLTTGAGQDLAVSMFVPGAATPSDHDEALDTEYLTAAGGGNHAADAAPDAYTQTTTSYLMVDAVDVRNPNVAGAIVVAGGSVVDGNGSNKTGPLGTGPAAPVNSRWSDDLARRIVKEAPTKDQLTVAEAGIASGTASDQCSSIPGTPATPYSNVVDRLDRDVLSLSNVKFLLLYAGTNDLGIGTGCSADTIIAAMRNIVSRAHARGIKVIISTVTPRLTYTPLQNEQRHLINIWITKWNRCGGECDGTVNFDAAISWYLNPNAMDPALDNGDTIHPNAEGYQKMADSIDLKLFSRS